MALNVFVALNRSLDEVIERGYEPPMNLSLQQQAAGLLGFLLQHAASLPDGDRLALQD